MKRKVALLSFIISTVFILFNSCKNTAVSKNANNPINFQSVVLTSSTVKRFVSDTNFRYFLIEFKPTRSQGVLLEVTAYDNKNSKMITRVTLEKLANRAPTPLLNDFAGQYFLTKDRMLQNGVDGNTDYLLSPTRYGRDPSQRDEIYLKDSIYLRSIRKFESIRRSTVKNLVSYRVEQQIQAFQNGFSSFTLDPSPPAYADE